MIFPSIDQSQALRQLALLGQNPNDPIYFRFFYPSSDPRKEGDKGRKSNRLNFKEIEAYQRQGRGAYFVVNGQGHKNEDVTQGRVIFIEHDDLEKELQQELWKILDLPEPTFQVDTGGKSIHSYWVFSEVIPIEQWCQLQRDFLEYAEGDRSIKNPSRVMRLAGAWHISHDEEGNSVYNQSQIISASEKTYSYEELRGIIPSSQEEKRLPLLETTIERQGAEKFPTPKGYQIPRHPDQIKIPVPASVPLLECCRKEVRDWVATGVPQGSGRNDAAINVGLELVAVEGHLQSIGQRFTDSARQLFSEFCQRSSMTASEEEERWKWCSAKNPAPSCGSDGIEACLKGWYWREVVKPQSRSNQGSHKGQVKKVGQIPGQSKESKPSPESIPLSEAIKHILTNFPQDSLRVIALMDLASQWGRPYRDLETLARILEREGDMDEEIAEAIAHLSTHLSLYQQRLDLTRYLEPNFAQLLVKAAEALPTAPEYLFTPLLPAAASCAGAGSRVVINPGGGYVQPLIFWTGNVAHSGQAKTPPQQVVIKPLADMEAEANEVYELKKADYERDKSGDGPPPIRSRYILSNVTLATKFRIHAENPRGLLEYIDELASDFRRLNQFKKGQGDDLEQELSFFNGGSVSYDRSDARLFLERTAFNKMGTYQWDTLADLMKQPGFISSGYMARLLLCSIGEAPPRYLDLFKSHDAVILFQEKLRWLYEELRHLPKMDYLLSHEAKILFQAWNHTLIDGEMGEGQFGLSLVYSKIESYTARIALWLHLVNSLLFGQKISSVISGQTMQQAIEIASFYLGQHQLIFAHNDPQNKLDGLLLKVQTGAKKVLERTGKGITASWAKARFNSLKSWGVEKIRFGIFQLLSRCGYGYLQGEGSKMVYIPYDHQVVVTGLPSLNPSKTLGEIDKVGEKLVVSPTAQSYTVSQLPATIGEIGGFTNSLGIENLDEINPHNLVKQQLEGNGLLENHQFTNSSLSNLDDKPVLAVGDDHQLLHQSPTPQLLKEIEGLLDFLVDLESDEPTGFKTLEEWEALQKLAEDKINEIWDDLSNVCPDYLERYIKAVTKLLDFYLPQPPTPDAETLLSVNELKAMMLACDTLVQLKALKKSSTHEEIKEAYNTLTPEQRLKIDGIAATEVPYEVYRYIGASQQSKGQNLDPGALVYIDPACKKSRRFVPVWLLRSLELGWQKAMDVSRDCLEFVEKAVDNRIEGIEGHQGSLLDGLS